MGIWRATDAVAMRGERREPPPSWRDDYIEVEESGEPSERAPAVYYAPRGECEYCDRRRAAAARSMARTREREG